MAPLALRMTPAARPASIKASLGGRRANAAPVVRPITAQRPRPVVSTRPRVFSARGAGARASAGGGNGAAKLDQLGSTVEGAGPEPSQIKTTKSTGWTPVDPVWEATEAVAVKRGTMPALISPPWKVMLLSDGSVTRHLQLLTDLPDVEVDCIEMRNVGRCDSRIDGLPGAVDLIKGDIVQRQVYLRSAAAGGAALVVDKYMTERDQPIWANLTSQKLELYRDVQRIYLGHSSELEEAFGQKGPFWARHYVFWNGGKPLTVIYEVFSTTIEAYLGPWAPEAWSEVARKSQDDA